MAQTSRSSPAIGGAVPTQCSQMGVERNELRRRRMCEPDDDGGKADVPDFDLGLTHLTESRMP